MLSVILLCAVKTLKTCFLAAFYDFKRVRVIDPPRLDKGPSPVIFPRKHGFYSEFFPEASPTP